MAALLLYIIVIAFGALAFIYYSTSKTEPFAKKVRFSDNVDVKTYIPDTLTSCSLSALGDDSDSCLDDDLVDAETKREFARKIKQDHVDYLQASSAFYKYVTNEDAVLKQEPGPDPFTNPSCYMGQTLEDIYNKQFTYYKAR